MKIRQERIPWRAALRVPMAGVDKLPGRARPRVHAPPAPAALQPPEQGLSLPAASSAPSWPASALPPAAPRTPGASRAGARLPP